MKKSIDIFAYAETILKALPKGILLTTACEGKANTMIIGWGSPGKPVHPSAAEEDRRIHHQRALDGSGPENRRSLRPQVRPGPG